MLLCVLHDVPKPLTVTLCTSNSGCVFPNWVNRIWGDMGVVLSRPDQVRSIFGDIVCASETSNPVGCVRTVGMEGDDYGGTVALTRTGSGESAAGVICPTGLDGLVDGVTAGGSDKKGGHVNMRDIAQDICGSQPGIVHPRASQPGELCKPDELHVPASKLNRPYLSLCLFVSIGRWFATNRERLMCVTGQINDWKLAKSYPVVSFAQGCAPVECHNFAPLFAQT